MGEPVACHACLLCGNPAPIETHSLPTPSTNLGQNPRATDPQLAEVRSIIDEATQSLTAVNEDISRTQAALDRLIEHRDALGESIRSHTRLLSLVHRMPPDILYEIFRMCCANDAEDAFEAVDRVPLTLSHVSSDWREMCLSFPQLWAKISEKRLQASTALMELFLTRSKSLPLTIFSSVCSGPNVVGNTPQDRLPNARAREAIQVLLSASHRWRRATFRMPTHLFDIFQAGIYEFSALEYLALSVDCRSFGHAAALPVPLALNSFAGASKLTHVSVELCDYGGQSSWIVTHFPWAQITDLRLCQDAFLSLGITHNVLSLVSNLESLTVLEARLYSYRRTLPPTPHCMVNLRFLNVTNLKVLSYLVCPQLESLEITASTTNSKRDCSEFNRNITSFLSTSCGSSIRQFKLTVNIDHGSCEDGLDDHLMLQSYLALTPFIETLHIHIVMKYFEASGGFGPRQANAIARSLIYNSTDDNYKPALCKHLKHLSLTGDFRSSQLVKILCSRSMLNTKPSPPASLLSASICTPDVLACSTDISPLAEKAWDAAG